jgi:hypothetical protein
LLQAAPYIRRQATGGLVPDDNRSLRPASAARRTSRAVSGNRPAAKSREPACQAPRTTATRSKVPSAATKPALLAGGNPRIAKARFSCTVEQFNRRRS